MADNFATAQERDEEIHHLARRWMCLERLKDQTLTESLQWYLEQMKLLAPTLDSSMALLGGQEFLEKVREARLAITGTERPHSSGHTTSVAQPADDLYLQGEATVAAWSVPYIGNAHILLRQAIKEAGVSNRARKGRFFSIIQSSGMGKSRTVDELSKQLFTLPFNIRENDSGKAYPLSDKDIRDYMIDSGRRKTHLEASGRFLNLFACLFDAVRETLERNTNWGNRLPECWYQWLKSVAAGQTKKTNRENLYEGASDNTHDLNTSIRREIDKQQQEERARTSSTRRDYGPSTRSVSYPEIAASHAKEALKKLEDTIKLFDAPISEGLPMILIYFDECYRLAQPWISPCYETDKTKAETTFFDALCTALDYLDTSSIFTLFISTSSLIRRHMPYQMNYWPVFPTTAPWSAPFTELPFDCHPDFPIYEDLEPRQCWRPLTLDKVTSLEFLCAFGRPMFWTRYLKSDVFIKHEVYHFAATKLQGAAERAFDKDAASGLWGTIDYSTGGLTDIGSARLAVFHTRLLLDFEPNRQPLHASVASKLVEWHMGVAFSIPVRGEDLTVGYPSEPILADASARLMRYFNLFGPDMVCKNLLKHVDEGLLLQDDRSEMVARLLLTLAYDQAYRINPRRQGGGYRNSDSRAVSVKEFLTALVGDEHWERIKTARPDNLSDGVTLEDAFESAWIRFTHFNRALDDSGCTVRSAMAAFVRGMAIQCHSTKGVVNIILPIFFESTNPAEPHEIVLPHISGILISVKNREKVIAGQKVEIDATNVGFFPTTSSPFNETPRPYIVIAMELGAQPSSNLDDPETLRVEKRTNLDRDDFDENLNPVKRLRISSPTPPSTHPPPGQHILTADPEDEAASVSGSSTTVNSRSHPRYTISIQGCSPRVYPVIQEEENYAHLLGSRRAPMEHPRQHDRFLGGLWSLKPQWTSLAAKECYEWFDGAPGDGDFEVLKEGVFIGPARS